MSDFDVSLPIGVMTEERILKRIKEKYPEAYRVEGYEKRWDILIPEKKLSVEVKMDYKGSYTGNVLVEIEMYGKPSGIATTASDWWVFVTRDLAIWATPEKIVTCIGVNHLKPFHFVGKGDAEPKWAYKVPVNKLKKYAKSNQRGFENEPNA